MDIDDRLELTQTFAAEAEEQLDSLVEGLLAIEENPGATDVLRGLFRTVHTLKGNTQVVGFSGLTELSHAMEDVLERLLEEPQLAKPELVSLLLDAVDSLRELIPAAMSGAEVSSPAREPLRRWLELHAPATPQRAVSAFPEQESPSKGEGSKERSFRGVRVDAERLDRILDLLGELTIARGRLSTLLDGAGASLPEVRDAHRDSERLVLELQERVMQLRMVPVRQLFRQHLRTVRDLAQAEGKQARLHLEGEELELDTSLVDALRAPLLHLIRNAVDHGIEAPAERARKGKDPLGQVSLRAWQQGGRAMLEVSDDGAGLDHSAILARAREAGLVGAEVPSGAELQRLIFEPGFSTAKAVSEVSGRGVGLDVVKRTIERLGGTLSVESRPGDGTSIVLGLPLTLALIEGFSVGVGDQTYVIPMEAVLECIELPRAERARGERRGVLNLRGEPVPFLRLHESLEVKPAQSARESVVVVRYPGGRAGLAVDALKGTSQTVVKPIPAQMRGVPGVAGATLLGDGRVALILEVDRLLERELVHAPAETSSEA